MTEETKDKFICCIYSMIQLRMKEELPVWMVRVLIATS